MNIVHMYDLIWFGMVNILQPFWYINCRNEGLNMELLKLE